MDQKVVDFLKEYKELFQVYKNQVDWKQIYELAIDKLGGYLGKFTEFWFQKNIHPENYLLEIPKYFLYRQHITSFEIPSNVISIGDNAFSFCDRLTSVTIPDNVTSIGAGAFYGCSGLMNATIGNSVTTIGSTAFYRCTSLMSINIPNSVTSIGYYVFIDCGEDLVINYSGTKAQFEALTEGKVNGTYFTAHCADGDIVKKR